MNVFVNNGLTHNLFIGLGDNSNQEVQKNNEDEHLVQEPHYPNDCNHQRILGWGDIQFTVKIKVVLWWSDITDWVSVHLKESSHLKTKTIIVTCLNSHTHNEWLNSEEDYPNYKECSELLNIRNALSNKLNQKSEVSIDSQEEHDLHERLHQDQHTEDLQRKEDVSVFWLVYRHRMITVLVVDDRDIISKGWQSQQEVNSNEEEAHEIKQVPDLIQVLTTLIFHLLELKIKEVAGGGHLNAVTNNNSHPISCHKLDEEGSHHCRNVEDHQWKEVAVWYLELLIYDVPNRWLVLNVVSCFCDYLAH